MAVASPTRYRRCMLVRMRAALCLVPLALVAAALAPAALAAPGEPDQSFGSGGVVRLLPSNEDVIMRAVATQPDGRVVLAGGDFATKTTVVVRLLENGALDPSFGGDGIVNLALGAEGSIAQAALIQPDGKILLAGAAKAATFDFMAARLNADGSPDPGFGGGDGNVLVPVGAGQDTAGAIGLGPGGRIVLAGEVDLPAEQDGAGVAVLGADGQPDGGYFGGKGTTIETTTPKSDEGVAATMLADGRILLADENGAGAGKGFTLIQLLASGTRDPSFGGGDGLVEVAPPSAGSPTPLGGRITDFVPLGEGRIAAAGYGVDQVGTGTVLKAAVGLFRADGQLEPGFGSGGWFTERFGPFESAAQTIDATPSGRLVIAGPNTVETTPVAIDSPALARIEPGGFLDPSFGKAGLVVNGVTAPFGESFDDAGLDSLERTVVLSHAFIGGGNTEVVVRRYLGDIAPKAPNRAPHARMKRVPKKVKANRLRGFAGGADDPDGAIARVQIAVLKLVPGGARASARKAPKCLALKNAKAKFKAQKPRGAKGKKRCQPRWLTVKGKAKWGFKLKRNLPPGRYVVYARAIDTEGLAESSFSRRAGNRYAFRVLRAD